jgi:hypothetical protein
MTRGKLRPSTFAVVLVALTGVVLGGMLVPYVKVAATTTRTSTSAGTTAAGVGSQATGTDGGATAQGGGSGTASAAGGTTSGGSTSSAAGGIAAGGATAGADGPGVTANQVKVGIGILDIGAAKNFGYAFDLGDQQARFDAMITAQNAKGGINGRQIVPSYHVVDALKEESRQAACIAWTQDEHVFSVLVSSQWSEAATVCVIGQGGTPMFTADGVDRSYYGNGLLFTTQPSDNRILADQAAYLIQGGQLAGKRIGVLSGDGAERLAVDDTLVPALGAAGYAVSDIEVVPADISGTQKMPIAISNFKAAGIDFVIIAANVILAGPFVQSADRAGFHPAYALSDFNNQINDQVASYYPDAFEGTIGLSNHDFSEYRAGNPPPAADQACLDRVLPADPKVLPSTNSAFEVAMEECGMFDAWVAGALNAGATLNAATLVTGMESTGTRSIAGVFDGSFAPGKHDAVDNVRPVAWHKSCTCWEIAGPIRGMQ